MYILLAEFDFIVTRHTVHIILYSMDADKNIVTHIPRSFKGFNAQGGGNL